MKVCLGCFTEISGEKWKCTQCGWDPVLINGVYFFAPEISGVTESYDPTWYAELATLEENNFWFGARNKLISWLAKKFCPLEAKYLEVGCGTGFVLRMLEKKFPLWSIFATEAQPEGITFSQKRASRDAIFFQMNICAIPFRNEFDVIGAFDVIEHVRDDINAMEQIYAALKPGGTFILSVPQHMFLWSKFDESGCHFRRYSKKELENKLKPIGFDILSSMSFNSLLLPLMILVRYMNDRKKKVDVLDECRISPRINFILSVVLKLEFRLIRLGLNFPVGGSRLIIAKKPK